jgi:group I intron endonuclease
MQPNEMNFAGIYMLRNVENGKIYIGQSKNIARRIKEHRRTHASTHLSHAICYHGWDTFEVVILERLDGEDIDLIDEREQYWLDEYKSYDATIGYNYAAWVGGPYPQKKTTDETRAKMRAAKLGKPLAPEHKAHVVAAIAKRYANHTNVPKAKRIPKKNEAPRALNFWVPATTHRLLRSAAVTRGVSMAEIARLAIDTWLQAQGICDVTR